MADDELEIESALGPLERWEEDIPILPAETDKNSHGPSQETRP